MRTALALTCVLVTALMGACAESTTTAPGDGAADASTDGAGGGGSSEAGLDGGGGADASSDGGLTGDGAVAGLEVDVTVDALAQDCMPIVAPDPATVQGTLMIKNNTTSQVGPFVFTDATVYTASGTQVVATFKVDTTTQQIAANGTGASVFEKQQSTLAPKNGCATLACGSDFVIELAFSGPGAPAGAKARSKAKTMLCTQ